MQVLGLRIIYEYVGWKIRKTKSIEQSSWWKRL